MSKLHFIIVTHTHTRTHTNTCSTVSQQTRVHDLRRRHRYDFIIIVIRTLVHRDVHLLVLRFCKYKYVFGGNPVANTPYVFCNSLTSLFDIVYSTARVHTYENISEPKALYTRLFCSPKQRV